MNAAYPATPGRLSPRTRCPTPRGAAAFTQPARPWQRAAHTRFASNQTKTPSLDSQHPPLQTRQSSQLLPAKQARSGANRSPCRRTVLCHFGTSWSASLRLVETAAMMRYEPRRGRRRRLRCWCKGITVALTLARDSPGRSGGACVAAGIRYRRGSGCGPERPIPSLARPRARGCSRDRRTSRRTGHDAA